MIMLKVLTQYQEATGRPARHSVHARATSPIRPTKMAAVPLKEWAIYRWQDEVFSVVWLYNRTGDASLLDLAQAATASGLRLEGAVRELPLHRQGDESRREAQYARRQQRDGAEDVGRVVAGVGRCRRSRRGAAAARDDGPLSPAAERRAQRRRASTPAAIRRRGPSSAPWSRGCSRSSTCSPSSATRRSAIVWRRWRTTRCRRRSTDRCGRISTISSQIR